MLSPLVSLALTLLVAAYARATPTDENLVARQGIGATTATLMARQAKMFSGQGTFWDPALGSCGTHNTGTEMICALNKFDMDVRNVGTNPNNNAWCQKKVMVKAAGPASTCIVVDRCESPDCVAGNIDMSRAMYGSLTGGDFSAGRIPVTWCEGEGCMTGNVPASSSAPQAPPPPASSSQPVLVPLPADPSQVNRAGPSPSPSSLIPADSLAAHSGISFGVLACGVLVSLLLG